MIDNTNRMAESESRGDVPRELRRFNFGAFILPALWALDHGLFFWGIVFLILLPFHCALLFAIFLLLENDIANPFSIFVLIFIEFVRIGLSIHLALSGNVSAWRAKLYMSIKQYRSEQIRWLMIRLLLFPILFLLFMLINRSGLK